MRSMSGAVRDVLALAQSRARSRNAGELGVADVRWALAALDQGGLTAQQVLDAQPGTEASSSPTMLPFSPALSGLFTGTHEESVEMRALVRLTEES